jgi:signal transduction histidine kinase
MADFPAHHPGIFSPRVLRRLLAIFLPAAFLTGGVVLALYYQDLTKEHALYEQAAAHRVDLHADVIRREVKSVESDLLYLANQAILRDFLGGSTPRRRELQEEYLLFCRHRGVYDQIRYLDIRGRERIRINYNNGRPEVVSRRELQTKAGRYYFGQTLALSRGEVFASPFDLNVEHDAIERPLKPVIRFGTPVFNRRGVKRGILILNYLGAALMDKLARASAGYPGQVWLLNRAGFFLRGPTRQDEWGFMLGHDRTFANYYPDEWPRLAAAGDGQFRTAKGLFTFRTLASRVAGTRQHQVTRLLTQPGSPLLGSPAQPRPAGEGGDPGLIVVAHIPPKVLDGRATVLLRRLLLLDGVVLVLVFALAWYFGYAGVLRRDHERDLADSAARLRTLSTRLLTAQEDERRSLSRDLHDELGQVVTSVTLDLQRAAQASDRERKDELIGRALGGAGCLLERLHEISARLRPTLLDDLGLKDAVQNLLSEFERSTGIATQTELQFDQAKVPPAVSENTYRILQEALTNVSKHARAGEVFVGLRVGGGGVALTVCDAGVGFAPAAAGGRRLGILGMRERAELLEGTFHLQAEPGRGTEVRVTIPIPGGELE